MSDQIRSRRVTLRALTVTALTVGATVIAAGTPAFAAPDPFSGLSAAEVSTARWLAADLGISTAEAAERVARQQAQVELAEELTAELGAAAAGSYIDAETGELVVAVADADAVDAVEEAGAEAVVVEHSLAELRRIQADLTSLLPVGGTIGIDPVSNQVVMTVPQSESASRSTLGARVARYGDAVEVEYGAPAVRPQIAFYGGQQIQTSAGWICSAGFNARNSSGTNYVITAGHCTAGSSTWYGPTGLTLGTPAGASFPTNDYGRILNTNTSNHTPQGGVLHNGSFLDIVGAGNTTVGATLSKTGRTTGTTSGAVTRLNVTVNYGSSGIVYQLIETRICTQSGDSGGPLYSTSGIGVGIVSGGTVIGCSSSSFRSYFQPLPEALTAYSVTLL